MKNVLFVASECVPFIKTGGLADVVGALPKMFPKDEYDVRVVIPNYTCHGLDMNEKYAELSAKYCGAVAVSVLLICQMIKFANTITFRFIF